MTVAIVDRLRAATGADVRIIRGKHMLFGRLILASILALPLAACTAVKSLTTGSVAPVVVDDSATRLSQVAWTSARADKCGFVIDQARLKSSYIAYEATVTDPAGLAKVEQAYDAVRSVMVKKISPQADYCGAKVVGETRSDLARYLSGNFAARAVSNAEES
jgi:hypothetical protein